MKVGQRVRVLSDDRIGRTGFTYTGAVTYADLVGKVATIYRIDEDGYLIYVKFDDGWNMGYWARELEPVTPHTQVDTPTAKG